LKNYVSRKLWSISVYPILFLLVVWSVFAYEYFNRISFSNYGVLPRHFSGLKGVILSVFIHGDLEHIASNSLPILILGMLLFFFYKRIAIPVFVWIWLVSGLWLWIGGRNSSQHPVYHIGASTLIYGLATFLFFSGVFRKHLRLMVVSALVLFLYGSIMWGIFPFKEEISWEGHLFGSIAGLLVAFNYRKEGPQPKKYDWEDESDDDENNEEGNNLNSGSEGPIIINYVFKPSDENSSTDQRNSS
jgi:membrane associated rhomboid family serine protease